MTEAKTQITAIDPADYIAAVEPGKRREEARVLHALFQRITGEPAKMWGPSMIGYGEYRTTYASGRKVHAMRTGFSPRKAKLSLYLMGCSSDAATGHQRDALLARLGKHTTGQSCLYINKLADIDLAVLEELIAADWAAMQRLYPE